MFVNVSVSVLCVCVFLSLSLFVIVFIVFHACLSVCIRMCVWLLVCLQYKCVFFYFVLCFNIVLFFQCCVEFNVWFGLLCVVFFCVML